MGGNGPGVVVPVDDEQSDVISSLHATVTTAEASLLSKEALRPGRVGGDDMVVAALPLKPNHDRRRTAPFWELLREGLVGLASPPAKRLPRKEPRRLGSPAVPC